MTPRPPAEENIQVVDHLPLAASPLEGRDLFGLQELGRDDCLEEHGRLAVMRDWVLKPAALQPEGAQPFEEEVLPAGQANPGWRARMTFLGSRRRTKVSLSKMIGEARWPGSGDPER